MHSAREGLDRRGAYRVRPRTDKLILVAVRCGSSEVNGWISEVSVSGVRVTCERADARRLASHDHVQLVFALAPGELPLTVPGLIVRIQFPHRYTQLGIRFDEHALAEDPVMERKLTGYILRRQRECLPIWRGWHQ